MDNFTTARSEHPKESKRSRIATFSKLAFLLLFFHSVYSSVRSIGLYKSFSINTFALNNTLSFHEEYNDIVEEKKVDEGEKLRSSNDSSNNSTSKHQVDHVNQTSKLIQTKAGNETQLQILNVTNDDSLSDSNQPPDQKTAIVETNIVEADDDKSQSQIPRYNATDSDQPPNQNTTIIGNETNIVESDDNISQSQIPPYNTTDSNQRPNQNTTIIGNETNIVKADDDISQSQIPRYDATVLVQLSGEMANNLSKFAAAKSFQWFAEKHGLKLNLQIKHQSVRKWRGAARNVQLCFPNLRDMDFTFGDSKEYLQRKEEQDRLLGKDKVQGLTLHEGGNMTSVLENLQSLLASKEIPSNVLLNSTITLPIVFINNFVDFATLDQYRPQLLEWLAFDFEACCPSLLPEPEESVFHFRNFATELRRAISLGFEEMPPNQTAYELFGHLSRGDKVVMTSRSVNNRTQQFVNAFGERGISAKVLTGNSGVEDFCYLMKAKKELVGTTQSTFFYWAAFLGTGLKDGIQKVRSYFVIIPRTQKKEKKGTFPTPPDWQRSVNLQSMWSHEVFADNGGAIFQKIYPIMPNATGKI